MLTRGLLIFIFFATAQICALQASTLPARVVDGDTIAIGDTRYRLFGIDAPERGQSCIRDAVTFDCGAAAADYLVWLIGNDSVECHVIELDRYGRSVATCYTNDLDLNAAMVVAGQALAYRDYSMTYVSQEQQAQRHQRGLWATEFQSPWTYRNGTTLAQNAPADCHIKGNVSRTGERIYHLPGTRSYNLTRISGPIERWFCTENEALAAGWRATRG